MNREQKNRQLPLGKKLLFAVVATIGVLIMLEVVARIFTDPQKDRTLYDEHEAMIYGLGLPSLNESMEADPHQFWRLKEKLKDFRIHGSLVGDKIDFTVSTHNHLRSPPLSGKKTKPRILAIGDSCTFGIGVGDQDTWPAQLQTVLAEKHNVEVVNAGVPGYTAFQGRRFFERTGLALDPDIVIATFSFNDQRCWASRSDLETARLLRLAKWTRCLDQSRVYVCSRNFFRTGHLSEPVLQNNQRPRLTLSEFRNEIAKIHRLCDQREIRLILAIWPYRHLGTKVIQPIDPYQQLMVSFCKENSLPCANILDRFLATDADLFVDQCHANKDGCLIAAEVLQRSVEELLD